MTMSRRTFSIGLVSSAFSGLALGSQKIFATKNGQLPDYNQVMAYGELIKDKAGLLDLPAGFSYKVISEFGQKMDDGISLPTAFDGMGCFDLGNNQVALIRNHELSERSLKYQPLENYKGKEPQVYDYHESGRALPGGTSTLIYDMASGEKKQEFLSLLGTLRNCSGGITPWGSWLTCEESVSKAGEGVGKEHGWVFEVPASATGLVKPEPLKAMGRFNHEAAAVDPNTGVVYLTEDRGDSLFYRFIPHVPGQLAKGGRLQALVVKDNQDSRNWENTNWKQEQWLSVSWVDLDEVHSPNDDLRMQGYKKGASLFARGEGIHWGEEHVFFCCTSGGKAKLGQIMQYQPSIYEGTDKEQQAPGKIRLFVESEDANLFNYGDNLVVAPNGHLIVCEDQYTQVVHNHLRGITPEGKFYTLAYSPVQTEFAGACFSPDGSTLFVNLYHPGKTLAITGPWGAFQA